MRPYIHTALNIGLAFAMLLAFWRSGLSPHEDAVIYLDSAADTLRGDGPYVVINIWREQGYWMGDPRPRPTVEEGPYVYPPVLALVLIPFLALPRGVATYLCFLVGFLAVVGTAYLLSRLLGYRNLTAFLAIAALMVYFQPMRRNFWFAQVDTVVLGLLILGLALFTARREVLAGLAIALAVSVKPFAGFVLFYFLWKRSYRAAAALIVGSGLLVGVPLLALGLHTVGDYIAGTSWWVGPQAASTIANQSPSGMLLRGFTALNGPPRIAELPWLVLPLRGAVVLLVGVTLALLVSRERRLPGPTVVAEYGLLLLGMIAVSPLGEDLHFVYFAVPLLASAVLCYRAWAADRGMRLLGLAVLLMYGVFLYPLHTLLERDGPFYALCALAVVCVLALAYDVRQRRAGMLPEPGLTDAALMPPAAR